MMCYDVSFTVNIRAIADYFPGLIFDSQLDMELFPMDHIQGVAVFPSYPIIYINRDDKKEHIRSMQWSVIEFYQKTMPSVVKRNGMLNIRSERVLDDPSSYWYKIRNRRCLVPVTGIFEHRGIRGWKKKVPYWVKPKGQEIFFLPGLYSVAQLADTETGEVKEYWTFGLMTRAANSLMQMIHNDGENRHRMPLFLPLDIAKEFLSEGLEEHRYKEILNYEMPSGDLEYCTVYTIRSPKPRPDDKIKTALFEWENLPPLGTEQPV